MASRFKRYGRQARRLLPYPRLWAMLVGARIPTHFILGDQSGLSRPEAIAFNASGKLMAISNSRANSITLHMRSDVSPALYDPRPCCTISDSNALEYVHGLDFSPCETNLVAVAKFAHSLSMFTLVDSDSGSLEAKPLWSARGDECGLKYPADVSIHPSGKWIAVANRMQNGISVYRNSGPSGIFDPKPIQFVTDEDLSIHGLAAPHGLEFSPNGEFLLVGHKRFSKARKSKGESGLSVFRWRPDSGLDPDPIFVQLHGSTKIHQVAFHPSGEMVAVAAETAGVHVFDWRPEQRTMTERDIVSFARVQTRAKGIAFTREGNRFATTTESDEILFFECRV